MENRFFKRLKSIACILLTITGGGLMGISCSESEDEQQVEYANWKARNDAFFATLADSLAQNPQQWRRIALFSKDEATAKETEHVYVKVMRSSNEAESPLYTDSVRVSYRGRLLPSKTYAEGFVFDETAFGDYNPDTNGTRKFKLSTLVDGWITALMLMHRGDYWRLYVPSDMGYGDTDNTSTGIPGHSLLIFDITLCDFSHTGELMAPWSARRR